jgi:hypothetical protein
MQVPKLVDDEVQTTEGDLSARFHLLNVVELEDETHLKRNESVHKSLLPGVPISEVFILAIRISVSCTGIRRVAHKT